MNPLGGVCTETHFFLPWRNKCGAKLQNFLHPTKQFPRKNILVGSTGKIWRL